MNLNKWTLGLAAVGVVSLASAVQAQEAANTVLTALSSTTLSGYVDTSAQWNFGTGNEHLPPYKFNGVDKADGFNLDVIQVSLAKPLDESEWAAGYHVDVWLGPDANTLGTASWEGGYWGANDFAIRQAYVALRTPVGNGIDWKIGVFDSIIGYESVASPNDPNYTRSYGHSIEPQTHTGVLASYRINDNISLAAGIANTMGPTINQRPFPAYESDHRKAESFKTYMGSIALTAPDNWGFLSGSTLYAGVVNGFNDAERSSDYDENATSWYAGTTLATPVTGLRFGAAFDFLDVHHWSSFDERGDGNAWSVALYSSYQATEKLSFHLRGEYLDDQAHFFANQDNAYLDSEGNAFKVWALTATVQYDLWKNVLSRIEFRWDHSDKDRVFGYNPNSSISSGPTRKNACILAANLIYKF